MTNLSNLIAEKGFVLLDGALATELEARGEDLNDPLWSARVLMEAPEKIREVHLDYFRAGSDVATTASYQATVEGFAGRGLARAEALALIRRSVELAQAARDQYLAEEAQGPGRTLVIAGSVGPYGAYLADGSEYRGNYGLTEDELIAFHRPRFEALVDAGVDVLACETIPCLIEARAIVRLLEEFSGAEAWISFSARDGKHTSQGELLADCAAYLDLKPQVGAIGINCTAPGYISQLISEIRSATRKPIIVYPNSGETYDASTRTWLGETSCDAFGSQALGWYDAGAQIIGGCCRTTPEHITEIKKKLLR